MNTIVNPRFALMIISTLILTSCGVNMVSSINQIPEKYRAEAVKVNTIEVGMKRKRVHAILGKPHKSVSNIKDRWQVYSDDKIGGVEIIYLNDKVGKVVFARHTKPKFGFVKRESYSSIKSNEPQKTITFENTSKPRLCSSAATPLPDSLRDKILLSGFASSNNERVAVINGQMFRVGQHLSDEFIISRIGENSVEIRSKNQCYLIHK